MDGATRCIELAAKRQATIYAEIKAVLRMRSGVPLKRYERLIGKLRHAAIGIPHGKALFGPLNRILQLRPKNVYWDRCQDTKLALQDWRQLIREAARECTHSRELVPGAAAYRGTLDASGEGAGGVWLPGTESIAPIVWRYQWPPNIVAELITEDNPGGTITNSDLEMAAEVLGWLVLEGCVPLRWKHVGVCSDNSPTVAWATRWASRKSMAANRLLRVLATRLRVRRASPLVTKHIAGDRNTLSDIPSRSFGYKKEWHFVNDMDFLTFFNATFPLPNKNSWTGFRLTNAVAMKVTSELLTRGSSMAEWRRLPKLGRKYGKNGKSTAEISESLSTWTAAPSALLQGS